MSFGDLDKALEAAQKAVALEPNLARTRTILGFAYLMQVNIQQAKASFEKAIEFDQADYLPRLGLGLAKIREGDLQEGGTRDRNRRKPGPEQLHRPELSWAKPTTKRSADPLDEREYAIAKELDPKDPTPWFYDAIAKQTTNRPVEALQDMQKAIELNDNRAVYRSRLEFDSDLAARSAALGQNLQRSRFSAAGVGRRLEIGQHRSEQFLRAQISGRLLFCSAAPRDRQGQRTAAIPIAPASQHDAHPAASRRKQSISDQRRRTDGTLLQRV